MPAAVRITVTCQREVAPTSDKVILPERLRPFTPTTPADAPATNVSTMPRAPFWSSCGWGQSLTVSPFPGCRGWRAHRRGLLQADDVLAARRRLPVRRG